MTTRNHHHAWPSVLSEPLFDSDPKVQLKPFFTNHCNHKQDEFIGAAEYWKDGAQTHQIDVYIHGDDQEVCIRYGDDPSAYITVGTVCDLLTSCGTYHDHTHHAARAIIDEMCTIRTTRKDKTDEDNGNG